jgi:RND family efflux transporter MFP subunit
MTRSRLRIRIELAAALLAIVLPGLAAGCQRGPGGTDGSTDSDERGIPVVVAPAERASMAETVTVTGTIRAAREAAVSAQISAQVLDVKVREGDPVVKGQVLVTLDDAQTSSQLQQMEAGVKAARARLEAARRRLEVVEEGARVEEREIARSQLEQAESALRTAEADLERVSDLYEKGAVSKQQLDLAQNAYERERTNRDAALKSLELTEKGARPKEVEAARKEVEAAAAQLEQAEAALAQAGERQSYTVIESPLTGVVVQRHVEPGEVTNPGMGGPLLLLADPSSVYYEARVPERAALRVVPDQRVDVIVQGNGDRHVEGRVERLVPVADPQSRDFLIRIEITQGTDITKPGVFARGMIVVEESPQAVVVPKEALVERGGTTLIFVVVEGSAEQRAASVGLSDERRAEVLAGLAPGESVVVVGAEGLQDGDAVQVKENGGS